MSRFTLLPFNCSYNDVERLACGSSQAADLQLLANLWQLLWTTVQRSQIEASSAKLKARTKVLRAELQRLQTEKDRPSTVLQSRSSEVLMDLSEAMLKPSELKKVLEKCQKIFAEGEGLVNFPMTPLIETFMELGEYLPDDPIFDQLFESILLLSQQRESKATSGRMLLKRGQQKLSKGNRYEAIRLLGRAQCSLTMHECRAELITSLALCASAYESAGLLWAARSNTLLAASLAIDEYWDHGSVNIQTFACLKRLIWIELQLGRIPITFAWIEITTGASQSCKSSQKSSFPLR